MPSPSPFCTRASPSGDLDLSPEVSIGIAAVQSGDPAVTALTHADLALRRAKTARTGTRQRMTSSPGCPTAEPLWRTLERRRRDDVRSVVAIIDIDDFHDVNDVLGSTTGDLLLNLVASRIQEAFGTDRVARLSSDVFAAELDRDVVAVHPRDGYGGLCPAHPSLALISSYCAVIQGSPPDGLLAR